MAKTKHSLFYLARIFIFVKKCQRTFCVALFCCPAQLHFNFRSRSSCPHLAHIRAEINEKYAKYVGQHFQRHPFWAQDYFGPHCINVSNLTKFALFFFLSFLCSAMLKIRTTKLKQVIWPFIFCSFALYYTDYYYL